MTSVGESRSIEKKTALYESKIPTRYAIIREISKHDLCHIDIDTSYESRDGAQLINAVRMLTCLTARTQWLLVLEINHYHFISILLLLLRLTNDAILFF